MGQVSLMSEQFLQATKKLIEDPPCPLFPDASLFLYQAFGGLWCILLWMGMPAWSLLFFPIARLSLRAYKIAWARATKAQRMNSMMLCAIAAPVAAIVVNPGRFRELLEKAKAA